MKNVFARTVLALVLIPSFWMTSVGMAAAGDWVDTPGETVGKLADCMYDHKYMMPGHCSNPIQVSFTVLGFYKACVDAKRYSVGTELARWQGKDNDFRYMQFVPDYPGALSGLCYYYEAGSSSGKSGPHTWRFDY